MCNYKKDNADYKYYKSAWFTIAMVMTIICTGMTGVPSFANPSGGQVAAGNVTITSPTSRSMTIDQTSSKAIINWQSFNIGPNESTHFQQPAGGIALNRISATEGASAIYGRLTATGQIILINSAGIFFGPNSYVNVGGLIATTANISDRNFLLSNYQFANAPGSQGSIISQGEIIATNHGLIALVGSGVENSGLIVANFGHIVLAAGGAFTINFAGNDLVNFTITSPAANAGVDKNGNKLTSGVSNTGTLIADGGEILVSADTAQGVLDNSINMQGVAEARSVGTHNGEIIISGDPTNGDVIISGALNASGKQAGETGGTVIVTGDDILLGSSSSIDVSGNAGGGNIYVGGSAGPLPDANAVVMEPGATLNASAINSGNGGNVVLWSNQYTGFYGTILAEGGALGGNGGQVETSSHLDLQSFGNVNASAPHGLAGQWLMDPFNVNITTTTSGGAFNGLSPNVFTPTATGADANASTIDASLNGGTSVTINTGSSDAQTGIITVSSPITTSYSGSSIPTLILNAAGAITISSTIGFTGSGLYVALISGAAVTQGAGDVITASTLSVNSVTGESLAQGNVVSGFTAINTTSGNLSFSNTRPLVIAGITEAGTGALTITNTGAITQSGAISVASGASSFSAGSNAITLTNAGNSLAGAITLLNSGANNVSLTNGIATVLALSTVGQNLAITSSGAITQIGILTVPGTSSFNDGANSITLTSNNVLTGAVSITSTGAAVSLTNPGALSLGTLTLGNGTLTVKTTANPITQAAGSAITQTAGAGIASFSSTTGVITLTSPLNSFTGPVALTDTSTSLTQLTNNGAVSLGTISVGTGGLAVDSTAGGTTSGAITQASTDTITTAGTSSFTAGAAAIILSNANVLTGTVSLNNSGVLNNATLDNIGVLTLGSSTVGGNLLINNTVTLSEAASAAINAAGTVTIDANSNSTATDSFTMNSGSSIIAGGNAVTIVVNSVSAGKGNAVLGNIQSGVGGTITVSTTGSATNSGGNTTGGSITQNASTTLNAGAGGTFNLFVPESAGNGIGTSGANILTTAAGGTLNLQFGSGGAYVTNTGNLTLAAPTLSAVAPISVISTGTLTLPVYSFSMGSDNVTFESLGGPLTLNGSITTGNGNITLLGATGLTIGYAVDAAASGAVSLSTTISGDVNVLSGGSVTTGTSGIMTISAMNNLNIAGPISIGTGIPVISANQGGGSGNLTLASGGSIIVSGHPTFDILVNTPTAGTGGVYLNGGNILVSNLGSIIISTTGVATATGGNTTGGSITQTSGTIGSTSRANISIFVPSTGSSGISGVSGAGSHAISTQTSGDTLTLTAGSSGAFDYTTGSVTLAVAALAANSPLTVVATGTLTLPATAISTGTANLDLESDGGTLATAASLSTTSGNLTLVGDGGLTINNALTTGSGNILLNNTVSGTLDLAAAAAITSATGSLTMDSAGDVTMTAGAGVAINLGSTSAATGLVTINSDTSGSGASGFSMGDYTNSITTANTSANAITILVNNTSAGTYGAALGNLTTGAGGAITVSTTGTTSNSGGNTTGGSITQLANASLNVGAGGTFNLFVPTAGASAIGTVGSNIETVAAGGTVNLQLGSGGAYITNTGNLTLGTPTVTSANYPISVIATGVLTLPAFNFSTGSGVITFESEGGLLTTNGTLTTAGGNLTLASTARMTIANALTTGSGAISLTTSTAGSIMMNSPGSINSANGPLTISAFNNVTLNGSINEGSGTIAISANQGGGAGNFTLGSGSSINTTNVTPLAIGIDVNTASAGTGSALLGGNILAGNTGAIAISTTGVLTASGGNATGGSITQSAGTIGDLTGRDNILLLVPSTGSSGISGISGPGANAISTTTSSYTLTLTAGSAGAFDSTTGNITLVVPALAANSPLTVLATGALTVSSTPVSTGTANLDLEADGGSLLIQAAANLSTTTGNLTLVGGTGITLDSIMTTGSGNILMNNTTSGSLDLAAGSAINSTSGSLTLESAQTIVMANSSTSITLGSLSATTGLLTINANTSGGSSNNGFSMGTLASITTANASPNAITITDNTPGSGTSNTVLNNITMTGNGTLSVTSYGGNIIQVAGGNLSIGTGVGGIVNLTTSQTSLIGTLINPISVIEANVVNATSGTGGIALTNVSNTNGILLGAINTMGALSVVTTGPIAQQTPYSGSNAITISGTGTSILNAGAYSITLANPNNQLNANASANGNPFPSGPLVADNGTAINNTLDVNNSGANNITIVTQGILVMGNSSVGSGLLSLSGTNGVGEIYGNGQTITTAANAAGTILNGGTGPVVFENDVGNNFNGPVAIVTTNTTAGTISPNPGSMLNIMNNLAPLQLGTVNGTTTNVGGGLLASAQGSITQNDVLTVGGTMTVGATAPGTDILLNSFANNFGANPVAFGPFSATSGVTLADIRDFMIEATNSAASPASFIGLTGLRNVTLNFTGGTTLSLPTLALSGTLAIGGAMPVTQQPGATVAANVLTISTESSVNLGNSGNALLSLGAITTGGALIVNDSDGIVLNGNITAGGTGDTIELAGTSFTNNVGPSVLNPGSGNNFLIWSQNTPGSDVLGGLVYNFMQYNAVFGSTAVLGTGNGLLYSYAPVITAELTGTVSKVYDTTTTATLTSSNYTNAGIINGDTVTFTEPLGGLYSTANAGTNINVSVSGISITGATNGSVVVYGYQLASPTANANIGIITPATLTASLTGSVSKIYDTTNVATLLAANYVLSGVLGSDTVTLNNPTGTYATVNVGTGINVAVSGLAISGLSSGNYQLAATTANANIGIITPATLTASLIGSVSKVYDTNNVATLLAGNYVLSGVLGSDTVTLNNPTSGTYATVNVGTGINVAVSGLAISGLSSGNYQLAATTANANIGIITPATLTASLTGSVSKIYDTTNVATLLAANYVLSGVLGSDTVTLNNPTGTYATVNVGTGINVAVSGLAISGLSSGNYHLATTTANANIGIITPATLTASLIGSISKVYDTTNVATLAAANYQLNGVLGSDTVVLNNPATGIYATANVGDNINVAVSGLTISGASVGNYQLVVTTANANIGIITPATLTASLIGSVSKIYDATNAATLAAGNYVLSGVLGSDMVILNNPVNGNYVTSDVGTGINVAVAGLAISGASSGNYVLAAQTANANIGIITPATLTASLTGSVSKIYDTTTVATLVAGNYVLSGVLGGETVVLNDPATGTYATANVGNNMNVAVTGLAISGASAGNYQLASTTAHADIGVITPATLTASLTGSVSKVYDATSVATLAGGNYVLSGVLGGDTVVLNDPSTGTYATANVGTNINVIVSGLTISGASSRNYQLAATIADADIGIITPATLTASLTGSVNKVYDTTTIATLVAGNYQLSGVLDGETVVLNNPATGVYATANVGNNINVAVSGLTISGASAGNYQLASSTANATIGVITPAILTASLTGSVSKVYDTTNVAALSGNYQLSGVLGSDTVVLNDPATGTYATVNVGSNINVAVSGLTIGGASAGNYQLSSTAANTNIGIITPATLTASLIGTVSKLYDATTVATLTPDNYQLSGVLGSDVVILNDPTTGIYATANRGVNINVSVSGLAISGTSAGNYQLAATTANANIGIITPVTLTTSLTASLTGSVSKVYDATTVATLAADNYVLTGVMGGDTVVLNDPTTGTYATANVGTGINVSVAGLAISGASAGNYLLVSTTVNGNIGIITPATLTASLTGSVSKVYNTTTTASLAAGNYQLNGVFGGDTVILNDPTAGTYATANVGNNMNVTVSGLAISGASAGNYLLATAQANGNIGIITPATLTASLIGSVSKVYDTTTTAILAAGNYHLSGVLGGDVITLNEPDVGAYATANVGTDINIAVSGLAIGGTSARNYLLASSTANGNIGIITPATLTASLTGSVTKVYDTTNAATLAPGNYVLSGVLGSDSVAINDTVSGTYASVNVGNNINVAVSGLVLSGASAGNYQLASTTANANIGMITPATLIASLTGSVSKIYDTTTTASLAAGNYQIYGVLGSDVITLNNPATGAYGSANVGTNINVAVSGLAIGGASAENYQLLSTTANGNIGIITPATLTASLTGGVSKVYDTTNIATLAAGNYQLSGVLGSDSVTINDTVNGTYASVNVGNNLNVAVSGLTLSGASAGNYQLASTSANADIGTITPATLIASLTGSVTKVYDASNAAALTPGNYILSGVLGGDTVALNDPVNGTYASANVGTNINVAVAGLAIGGASSGNYQLAATTANANIGTITSGGPVPPPIPPIPPVPTPVVSPVAVASIISSYGRNPNVNAGIYEAIGTISITDDTGLTANQAATSSTVITMEGAGLNIASSEGNNAGSQRTYSRVSGIFPEGFYAATQETFANFHALVAEKNLPFLFLLVLLPLLTASFTQRSAAKSAYSLRDDLPIVSFQLRSALNSIIGLSALLYNDEVGQLTPIQKQFLAVIIAGSSDIMADLAKLEADNTQPDTQLTTLSFKLRTSLNNINGYADLIYRGQAGTISEKQKGFMQDIIEGSNKILRLI